MDSEKILLGNEKGILRAYGEEGQINIIRFLSEIFSV